jgi:ABC-type multidrug transport system ATPase subunit
VSAPTVDLAGVSRRFGTVTAVDDVTWHAGEGDVVGLLGHNGAGKTTTLRLISGVLAASEGVVRVFGMDPVDRGDEVRRRLGVLLAQPPVDRRLTGRENLEFAARLFGLDRGRARDRIEDWSSRSTSTTASTTGPTTTARACCSGSHWHGCWCPTRHCCCSTSRPRRWTRWPRTGCAS